jgi:type II secretory pathway pseudopilin PulG
MTAVELVRGNRGIATSLIETVMVIGIAAVIAGIALNAAIDRIEDARLTRAAADTKMLAVAIHSFMHDTGFAPAFKSGESRGPEDAIFKVLVTEGDEPGMGSDELAWPEAPEDRDLLVNHLMKNLPSGTGPRYPRVGEISFARSKGWNGPYLMTVPTADPWNDKYFVNVHFLAPKVLSELDLPTGTRAAVFVASAGPNRLLETKFQQLADQFVAGGDDIVFRVQ